MEFKHIKKEKGEVIIPDRYLDHSPQPSNELVKLVNDYITHHAFVTYPFRPTQNEKNEIENNSALCRSLENEIKETGYTGVFALARYGYTAMVNIDFSRKNKYKFIKIKWLHTV